MSHRERSNELVNLCKQLLNYLASFDDIQEWLDNNKSNQDLLSRAANYQDEESSTPLHYLIMKKTPSDLVGRLLQLAPDTIKKQDMNRDLPLHRALKYKASSDVINMLFQAYPQAAEIQNKYGYLPLHIALHRNASNNVINMLFQDYPEAAEIRCDRGELPPLKFTPSSFN
jgi:ankyrin repeat protein